MRIYILYVNMCIYIILNISIYIIYMDTRAYGHPEPSRLDFFSECADEPHIQRWVHRTNATLMGKGVSTATGSPDRSSLNVSHHVHIHHASGVCVCVSAL